MCTCTTLQQQFQQTEDHTSTYIWTFDCHSFVFLLLVEEAYVIHWVLVPFPKVQFDDLYKSKLN